MPRNKTIRDASRLSGKPLAETIAPSAILKTTPPDDWVTSEDLTESDLPFVPEAIEQLTIFLLDNININSSHLFRADILYDSQGILRTPQQKAELFAQTGNNNEAIDAEDSVDPLPAREIDGFDLTRTVVRRLIPRNPKLDRPLEQTCHFYKATEVSGEGVGETPSCHRFLAVYTPHIKSKEDLPFYHPHLRSLAYLYEYKYATDPTAEIEGSGTLSLHFLLYPEDPIPTRLERTLLALMNTQIRLARNTRLSDAPEGGNHNPDKDNIIPRHLIQNTYTRLKDKYAPDLCKRWVENTEPSKHVFEDLAITAFLVELWRSMYGVVPADEGDSTSKFPGFVDVACGNGVLVYVLCMEGYKGWGFDARRRKTWSIFPESIQARLKEELYIPKPFADKMVELGKEDELLNLGVKTHTGIFPQGTFIISNHADELTVWTPLMAALASPESPLPFLAIPCCSHSLSGSRYRYPPPKSTSSKVHSKGVDDSAEHEVEQNPQPAAGDLRALRKAKEDSKTDLGFVKSMYGSLTLKAMSVAEEVGFGVEKTILRIPSTRNMGVMGGRARTIEEWRAKSSQGSTEAGAASDSDVNNSTSQETIERVMAVVQRECGREGGIEAAAKIWIERAKGLHQGQGKSKQEGH